MVTLPRGCDVISTSEFFGKRVALKPALPLTMFEQLVAKLGMSYLDERFSTLPDRPPVQVGNAVLGDHVVDVGASGKHSRAVPPIAARCATRFLA